MGHRDMGEVVTPPAPDSVEDVGITAIDHRYQFDPDAGLV